MRDSTPSSAPVSFRGRVRTTSLAALFATSLATGCAVAPSRATALAPYEHYARFDTTLYVGVSQRCADTAFGPVDEQLAYSIEADIRQPDDDVGLELGLYCSSDDASENVPGIGRVSFDASMTELSVGARWRYAELWRHFRPYASAGVAFVSASYGADPALSNSREGSDWTLGPYVRAGLEYTFDANWSLSLDYRQVLFTDVVKSLSIDGTSTDANYSQIGLVLGYAF